MKGQHNLYRRVVEAAEVIVKYNGDIFSAGSSVGAETELLSGSYAILDIPEERIEALYSLPEVEDLELPKRLFISTGFQLTTSCISDVQRDYGLTGKGVIVGIVDSGVDYTHTDLRSEDGSTRILYLWDQTINGDPPRGFNEGSEYSSAQINEALSQPDPFLVIPSRDYIGHGTAVAGIAAGNGRASSGVNRGVAPESSLIVVKVGRSAFDSFALTTEIMRGIKYITDKARSLDMPASINLSFGMNDGSHRGDSLFEQFLTDTADRWKLSIVVPTGNEGSSGHHFSGTVSAGIPKDIEFFTSPGLERLYLSLWKNFTDRFGVELIFPDGFSSGVINTESRTKTVRHDNMVLTVLYGQPSRYSIGQEIFFDLRSSTAIRPGLWQLRILPSEIVDGSIDIWLPTLEEVGSGTYFTEPSLFDTMTLPSTGNKLVRVSGYNDRLGGIADFSGTGSSTDKLFMPDLAAPAVNITAIRPGGGYDTVTGTSFASPFVTGSAALMMQWGIVEGNSPFFYGERIRAFLRIGALRSAGLSYPNATFGYGRLCLARTLQYMKDYKNGGAEPWLN